ncbi:MAG: endonuclease VII domain-containing protein [Lentisphaeria bacterium]
MSQKTRSEQAAKWRAANRTKATEATRRWRIAHPDREKTQNLSRRYGITNEDYNEILAGQDNKCAVCKCSVDSGRKFSVDHSHLLGNVRGILCSNCNAMLGQAHDMPSVLRAAAEYLERAMVD